MKKKLEGTEITRLRTISRHLDNAYAELEELVADLSDLEMHEEFDSVFEDLTEARDEAEAVRDKVDAHLPTTP